MNRFTIFCERDQILKAIKIGAPIEEIEDGCFVKPTADQMICWLEETYGLQFTHNVNMFNEWESNVYMKDSYDIIVEDGRHKTKKESILSAIDASLDYLLKKMNV